MSKKHLAAGSECPPQTPGTLRIYSMRYCPFAQRARLVLAHKNIPHETVNINLKSKPEWYFRKNPAGTVPTLEQDGKLVQESGICMDYLDDITLGNDLYPKDAYLKARMRVDMENASKLIGPFYKLLRSAESDRDECHQALLKHLAALERMLSGDFLSGDAPMMIDYFILPWFERFCMVEYTTGIDLLSAETLPKLRAWYARMVALPSVQASFTTPDNHATIATMYKTGQVDYNFELK